ncbi:Hypoxanthine-guanine phosphoribosyltransferase [Hyphomicrobium sulfonivorans]|uniref:Hypoxanthine phosphoribosyltransferase n=2 Tax=Hyphomicrobium sulfonivorans TaxID=121290 RepID=A0A109B926_HYPSL|nr:Hypoxanthine-guanine phosphoribosyltransferase [Hyphomicrobium sulfonivorans]
MRGTGLGVELMNDVTNAPNNELEVIFTPEDIARRLDELAQAIAAAKLDNLLVVAILKGSFVFAADLIRALHRHGLAPEVDFMTLSSYKKARISSGQVSILRDLDLDARGRNILIVDDVLDSGRTLAFAKDLLAARGAASIRTCVLLDKQLPRAVNLEPDYYAFLCPNEFVVGYGMDVAHRYRELPFVGRLVRP